MWVSPGRRASGDTPTSTPDVPNLLSELHRPVHPESIKRRPGGLRCARRLSLESRISYFGRSFLWRFYLTVVVKESRKEAKNAAPALTNSPEGRLTIGLGRAGPPSFWPSRGSLRRSVCLVSKIHSVINKRRSFCRRQRQAEKEKTETTHHNGLPNTQALRVPLSIHFTYSSPPFSQTSICSSVSPRVTVLHVASQEDEDPPPPTRSPGSAIRHSVTGKVTPCFLPARSTVSGVGGTGKGDDDDNDDENDDGRGEGEVIMKERK
ncbi:hypothetical protein E2C01_025233 [Portunus trituberculatus]|uniref:Uncharacterized protein n=1 Tax=Portunus trituberculatus TaxID=210409 RepID=A0A5B7EFY1_PORTR|nr:hypothetical protein [Portunus trituberculatus]